MDDDAFIADVEGTRAVMSALLRTPGVSIFEHTGQLLPDGRGRARASITPAAAKLLVELGATITVVTTAEERRAARRHAARHTQGTEPVELVTVIGTGDVLSDLAGKLGLDFPLYACRHLGEGRWEIATQASDEGLAALRRIGLDVEVLEDAERLAARRGEVS